jgi:hypothetical protein
MLSGAAVLGLYGDVGGKTKLGAGRLPIAPSILKIFKFLKWNTIHINSRFIDTLANISTNLKT